MNGVGLLVMSVVGRLGSDGNRWREIGGGWLGSGGVWRENGCCVRLENGVGWLGSGGVRREKDGGWLGSTGVPRVLGVGKGWFLGILGAGVEICFGACLRSPR